MRSMLVLAIAATVWLAAAEPVSAQAVQPYRPPIGETQAPEPPSFGLSIGLHVSAVIASTLGTGGVVFGGLFAFACAFGGACGLSIAAAISGGVLLTLGIALGISASAVHGHTRSVADRAYSVDVTPTLWADPTGAGGGLSLRF